MEKNIQLFIITLGCVVLLILVTLQRAEDFSKNAQNASFNIPTPDFSIQNDKIISTPKEITINNDLKITLTNEWTEQEKSDAFNSITGGGSEYFSLLHLSVKTSLTSAFPSFFMVQETDIINLEEIKEKITQTTEEDEQVTINASKNDDYGEIIELTYKSPEMSELNQLSRIIILDNYSYIITLATLSTEWDANKDDFYSIIESTQLLNKEYNNSNEYQVF